MPGARLLLIAGAVVAALLLVYALWRSRRRGGPMLVQPRPLPEMKGSLDASAGRIGIQLGREILPLLEQGRTDEAVALVRERTGMGAEEARASVERVVGLMKRLGME